MSEKIDYEKLADMIAKRIFDTPVKSVWTRKDQKRGSCTCTPGWELGECLTKPPKPRLEK